MEKQGTEPKDKKEWVKRRIATNGRKVGDATSMKPGCDPHPTCPSFGRKETLRRTDFIASF